jgi:hypothetical protein
MTVGAAPGVVEGEGARVEDADSAAPAPKNRIHRQLPTTGKSFFFIGLPLS